MATAGPPASRNNRVALMAAGGALAMLALGFAAVPLYRAFCQATGFGGTPQRATEAQAARVRTLAGKPISIRFDANIEPALKWRFAPEQNTVTVPIGQKSLAFFTSENLTDKPLSGQASYNIEPEEAAIYFHKVQCFCFNRQTLAPHEKVRMPVVFYVDPGVLADKDLKGLEQITLSYTFHPAPGS